MTSLISENLTTIDSLCIGSGRFLRSVLVPALVQAKYHPIIVQTRGRSFLDFLLQQHSSKQQWTYQVDTVHYDGTVETSEIPFWGAGTLGSSQGKQEILDLLQGQTLETSKPFLLGVGVTEAGLASANTQAMQDLYNVLFALSQNQKSPPKQVCVIDMDNIPQNGTLLQKYMNELASTSDEPMKDFLQNHVCFHNTMVDRITSQRPGSNGLVPRCEPTPLKALVIEDLGKVLPQELVALDECGVVVRTTPNRLDSDIALKLRVANGTHTAAAHTMALLGLVTTDVLSSTGTTTSGLLMKYLDSFFEYQILPGGLQTNEFDATQDDIQAVYDDWRRRLIHAHFGLSTFFITQNGAAKGGIRIGPTIRDLIQNATASCPIACSTVFALAALLRFLTGTIQEGGETDKLLFRGTLDPKQNDSEEKDGSGTVGYADGLSYNLKEGWYTFRCDCQVTIDGMATLLPVALSSVGTNQQPVAYGGVIRAYLCQPTGGNLSAISKTPSFGILVQAVSTLYARMVGGDSLLDILQSLDLEASCETLVDGERIR